jgi:peptidyl-prolyl cis-trans isomerase D
MITWMQHHKKYLIITIWISTIAFVGAGFVGWGAYDFNLNRASSVAKVGTHTISIQSYQNTYNNYFNYYNQAVYNGELTEELAKQIGLQNLVLNTLIDEAVLLNFADEMGITALDSDVVDMIMKDQNFQINGTFSKEVYLRTLQVAGLTPASYEESLKKQAILNKIYAIVFDLPVTETEKQLFGSAIFMQDRVSLATVTVPENEVKVTENETRTFWEMNNASFLTDQVYHFESVFVPVSKDKLDEEAIKAHWEDTKYFYRDDEDKILDYDKARAQVEADLRLKNAERDSLKAMLAFKKGELAAQKNISVKSSSGDYNVTAFASMSLGEVTEPIKEAEGYEVLKLISVTAPAPKSYEAAKAQITAILKANKRSEMLVQRAEGRLKLFSGKDIGFIDRTDKDIKGYTPEVSAQLVGNVFGSKNQRGYVVIGDTAYLYDITAQRLPDTQKLTENSDALTQNIKQLKGSEVRARLINMLKPRYKIEQYIRG